MVCYNLHLKKYMPLYMFMYVYMYAKYVRKDIQESDPIVGLKAAGQGFEGDSIGDFVLLNFLIHINKV